MSPAEHTGKAPSARRAFVPSDVGLRMEPGTAPTAIPRATAASTVWREPPWCLLSTTTTTSLRAASRRLRTGKRHFSVRTPAGDSDTIDPVLRHPLPQPGVPPRVGVVEPAGDHADGGRTGTARALVRRPVDPQREARDDADPGRRQVRSQLGRHADAIAGRGPRADERRPSEPVSSAVGSPRQNTIAGAPGSSSSRAGHAGCPAMSTLMPSSAWRSQIRATSEHRPRGADGPRPGRRRCVVGQQVAQRGRADRGHRRQRHGVRLLRQRHGTTAARPARSDSASATCANDTVSSPARSATVRATRATLRSPRALRAPDRSFEPSSVSASGARSGPRSVRRSRRSACPGGRDPGGHGRRGLARDAGEELVGIGPAEGHDEIETVQQRRRDPAAVPGAGDGAAGAGALVDALAAGAGVHGGDEEEGRREGDGATGAAHPDHPLLEGLAERLEGGHGELAELIEEEDPVGGETHLAGPERPAAATDQRDDRGLVVRGPERRAVEEGAVGQRSSRRPSGCG